MTSCWCKARAKLVLFIIAHAASMLETKQCDAALRTPMVSGMQAPSVSGSSNVNSPASTASVPNTVKVTNTCRTADVQQASEITTLGKMHHNQQAWLVVVTGQWPMGLSPKSQSISG